MIMELFEKLSLEINDGVKSLIKYFIYEVIN